VSSTDRSRTTHLDRLIEVLAVVLLAVATLGSAWCGYQASRWNGKETDHAREATDARVEASREFGLASQRVSYDSTMAAEYAQAYVDDNQKLLAFYRATLIRPEFLPVLDRWQAEIAAGQTPKNLTQDSEYLQQQLGRYNELEAKAEASTVASDVAGQESDDYVLTTVLLASALFFAGVTTSFRVRLPRLFLLAASGIIVAYAASRLTTLHVT
jgi:hypothetical protein